MDSVFVGKNFKMRHCIKGRTQRWGMRRLGREVGVEQLQSIMKAETPGVKAICNIRK